VCSAVSEETAKKVAFIKWVGYSTKNRGGRFGNNAVYTACVPVFARSQSLVQVSYVNQALMLSLGEQM